MINLQKMSEDEFEAYQQFSITNYAKEKVAAGNWDEEEALENARASYQDLLPDGRNTTDHYLYTVLNDHDEKVGSLWICKQTKDKAFIYDIRISDDHQGRAYGKETMILAEKEGQKIGVQKIGLHVFAHNKIARRLYENLGYQPTNIVMEKELE